jgi:hypothetical protein
MEQTQTTSQGGDQNQQQFPYFSNPNTYEIPQLGAFEMGESEDTTWANTEYNTAEAQNYDTNPVGTYSYGNHYHF